MAAETLPGSEADDNVNAALLDLLDAISEEDVPPRILALAMALNRVLAREHPRLAGQNSDPVPGGETPPS